MKDTRPPVARREWDVWRHTSEEFRQALALDLEQIAEGEIAICGLSRANASLEMKRRRGKEDTSHREYASASHASS